MRTVSAGRREVPSRARRGRRHGGCGHAVSVGWAGPPASTAAV